MFVDILTGNGEWISREDKIAALTLANLSYG
jgi:hypothetical protein